MNNNTNNIFDYHRKIELTKKINKITKKIHLVNIFKIIEEHNAEFTENDNGVFVLFHNLPNDAYVKIENYVNTVYHNHQQKKLNNELTTNTIENYTLSDDNNNNDLSNKEKIILKRKKYEEFINNNKD
jgi:hypothetical protein